MTAHFRRHCAINQAQLSGHTRTAEAMLAALRQEDFPFPAFAHHQPLQGVLARNLAPAINPAPAPVEPRGCVPLVTREQGEF